MPGFRKLAPSNLCLTPHVGRAWRDSRLRVGVTRMQFTRLLPYPEVTINVGLRKLMRLPRYLL